jgi:uncharacterized membrane protein
MVENTKVEQWDVVAGALRIASLDRPSEPLAVLVGALLAVMENHGLRNEAYAEVQDVLRRYTKGNQ